ncbi:MAG: hypothetical protein AAGJ97_03530, partial [Planctomycetota bacterium]
FGLSRGDLVGVGRSQEGPRGDPGRRADLHETGTVSHPPERGVPRRPKKRRRPDPAARHAREDDAVADLLGPADVPEPPTEASSPPAERRDAGPGDALDRDTSISADETAGGTKPLIDDEHEVGGLHVKEYQPEPEEPASSVPDMPDHPSAGGLQTRAYEPEPQPVEAADSAADGPGYDGDLHAVRDEPVGKNAAVRRKPSKEKKANKPDAPVDPDAGQSVRVRATADDVERAAAEAEAARDAAIDVTLRPPTDDVAARGSTVPWTGVATLAVVTAFGFLNVFRFYGDALPDELIDARAEVAAAEEKLEYYNELLSRNMNPDTVGRKQAQVAEAEAVVAARTAAADKAESDFQARMLALAERWAAGGVTHWVGEYFVLLGAGMTGLMRLGPLTASFGFFSDFTGRGSVAVVGVVAALGWATASLMLALIGRWTIRAPLWISRKAPPFGRFDRRLGVEWPWVAFAVRLLPGVPSLPFDVLAGLFAVSKLRLFVAFFAGSVIVTTMWASVGGDAGSILAVRLGEARPSAGTQWVWCGGGFAVLALRLTLSGALAGLFAKRVKEKAEDKQADEAVETAV